MQKIKPTKFFILVLFSCSFYSCGFKLDPSPLYPTHISKIEEETNKRKKESQKNSSNQEAPSAKKESE
ncbi:hypothetical protein [Fluviispira sanaruensis]|uniref:Lipoprotein n=1 Tax=Fluviispira sanaruensis TaxID=2493639 RepID=A0A4P2VGT5_FLUSA|nr:hypothetical protein [Fluviispira sanaruensis]BBH52036.1 hypothetical protein JCM31447_04730 [Fluviispira sanaruensis]